MVDEDSESPLGSGTEGVDEMDEPIDAVHRLDDDRQLGELVAPHVLQELGIVASFDPDAARPSDVCALRRAVRASCIRG